MPMQAQRGSGGTAPTHPKFGNGMGELSAPRPSRFTHGKYPVPNVQYRRLGGHRNRSRKCHPPGFNPRTVQPIVRRYIDYDVLVFIQYRV